MENVKNLSAFTNLYSLSKTLRFELIPQGATLKHIQSKGLLNKDFERSENYTRIKKLIDEYHKWFIELCLRTSEIPEIENAYELFNTKSDDISVLLKLSNEKLRKLIKEYFSNGTEKEKWKTLFSEDLIKRELPQFIQSIYPESEAFELLAIINSFSKFTTYFTGFHQNRENIYSSEPIVTAIGYRIVHENMPKHFANCNNFLNTVSKFDIDFTEVINNFGTELNINSVDEIFTPKFFNKCLSQKGIEKYNMLLGGKTSSDGAKLKGINEIINLYRQQNGLKARQLPTMTLLYKQILSDREKQSMIPEQLKDINEVNQIITAYFKNEFYNEENIEGKVNVIHALRDLMAGFKQDAFDTSLIYIRNNTVITDISQYIFDDWVTINAAIRYAAYYRLNQSKQGKTLTKADDDKITKYLKQNFFTVSEIEDSLQLYFENEVIDETVKLKYKPNCIVEYFEQFTCMIGDKGNRKEINVLDALKEPYESALQLLNSKFDHTDRFDKKQKEVLKNLLDTAINILHFIKPLSIKAGTKENDNLEYDLEFYNKYNTILDQLEALIPVYNRVRNFATQKPYSDEKVKLNFENSQLLNGWDVNKEADNTCVLFKRKENYYLGIIDKINANIFKKIPKTEGNEGYQKMFYKLLPGPNKMLPKVIFSDKWIKYFNPNETLLNNYEKGMHKKGASFNKAFCYELIDFFKECLSKHEDWQQFGFKFSPTNTYDDISGFYKEISQQGYKLYFSNIEESYINQMVDEGKLYLFQIYNKDFSQYSKGKPNLHTIYWRALFDEENIKNVVYKLNGEAEVFYRKSSITKEKRIVHDANGLIDNKNPNNPKKQSSFKYDIVKDKRFTQDKFHFHVPITMNFKADGNDRINDKVNAFLKDNPSVNIIGIDRGERHLAYYTVINQKGEIIEQNSFNTISNTHNGLVYNNDYHLALDTKEKDRDTARKTWDSIENIKELKEGYLSQVVHKICTLMIHHNAIVVLEDLNFGFKRGRFKVEKQVYQKLEKALIEKLNYFIDKNLQSSESGGAMHALQLTSKFESFEKLGKQSGFIYYVPAQHTSKIDPATGFINLLYPKYESIEKAKQLIKKIDTIKYNGNKNYFEFTIDYKNIDPKTELHKTIWTICTYGNERYQYNPSTKETITINVTDKLKELFDKHRINYTSLKDCKQDILSQTEKEFFQSLLYYFKLTLTLRHTDAKGNDKILSPVANSKGIFFESNNAASSMPQNADANGAYHIALKGLLLMKKINEKEKDKVDLKITNIDWYNYVQNR